MRKFQSLFKNTNYENNPEGTWQHAKNILISEKFNSPLNENGTKFSHLIPETNEHYVVGVIETNLEIVYFSKVLNNSNYNSRIDVYTINTNTIENRLKGNFNFNQPIEGIYFYDYKSRLIVAWCDGIKSNSNTPKILRLNEIEYPLTIDNVLEDKYIELIELFSSNLRGEVEAITSNGNIDGIYAYATFKYCFKEDETIFKPLHTYAYIREQLFNEENFHQKGLELKFTNLDYELYSSIIIGLYIITENGEQSYQSKKININSSDKVVNVTSLSNYITINNEELILPKAHYIKAETITSHKTSILLGNVEERNKINLQKYINLLKLKPVTGRTNINHPESTYLKRLMPGEVYNFLIQIKFKDGNTTEWFTIPNNTLPTENEKENLNTINDEVYRWEHNRYSQDDLNYKSFHVVNNGDKNKFGYWENENLTYPNINEFNSLVDYNGNTITNGVDYRNKKISYHRIPDFSHTYGFTIENQEVIPASIRQNIQTIRVGFQKRNLGNSLVVANGTAVPVRKLTYNSLENSNFPTEDSNITNIPSTPFSYDSRRTANNGSESTTNNEGNSFDRILLLNPELDKFNPKINFNLTQVNSVVFPGNFVQNNWTGNKEEEYYEVNPIINPVKYNANKYYFGFYSYDYKLPNNTEHGSINSDGGLYINYSDRFDNYISGIFGKTNLGYSLSSGTEVYSFMPHADAELLDGVGEELDIDGDNHTEYDDFKIINLPMTQGGQDGSKPYAFANITLFNIKKDLYELNAINIVSSTNFYYNSVSFNLNNFQFLIGDVDIIEVKGNLKYTKSLPAFTNNTNSKYPFKSLNNAFETINTSVNQFNFKPTVIHTPFAQTVYNIKGVKPSTLNINHTDIEQLNTLIYGYENKLVENTNSLNDLAGYISYDYNEQYITKFKDFVVRSLTAGDESYILNNLKVFLANAYYKIGLNKGEIIALRSNEYELYIQLRYELLKATIREVIATENTETYLREGDLFDRTPKPVTLAKKGYIGCEHKFACKLYKEGYFTIDHKKGNIIIVNSKYDLLAYKEIGNWLANNLEYTETELIDTEDNKLIDNPFINIGFSIGYDDRYKRLFITKLYPNNAEFDYYKYTLSIDLITFKPVCYHDLIANYYYNIDNKLYALKQSENTVLLPKIHQVNKGNKGTYFDRNYTSYIDIIFNKGSDTAKKYQNIEIYSTVFEGDSIIKNDTIDQIVVFNDNQCSKPLQLDLNNKDIVRGVEGEFRINNFRNVVINSDNPIINKDGTINLSNLNFSKLWFNKSLFISNFIVVRIIWNNSNNRDKYLNEVKVISQISPR